MEKYIRIGETKIYNLVTLTGHLEHAFKQSSIFFFNWRSKMLILKEVYTTQGGDQPSGTGSHQILPGFT